MSRSKVISRRIVVGRPSRTRQMNVCGDRFALTGRPQRSDVMASEAATSETACLAVAPAAVSRTRPIVRSNRLRRGGAGEMFGGGSGGEGCVGSGAGAAGAAGVGVRVEARAAPATADATIAAIVKTARAPREDLTATPLLERFAVTARAGIRHFAVNAPAEGSSITSVPVGIVFTVLAALSGMERVHPRPHPGRQEEGPTPLTRDRPVDAP